MTLESDHPRFSLLTLRKDNDGKVPFSCFQSLSGRPWNYAKWLLKHLSPVGRHSSPCCPRFKKYHSLLKPLLASLRSMECQVSLHIQDNPLLLHVYRHISWYYYSTPVIFSIFSNGLLSPACSGQPWKMPVSYQRAMWPSEMWCEEWDVVWGVRWDGLKKWEMFWNLCLDVSLELPSWNHSK